MYLNDGAILDIAEHRAAFRNKSVAAGLDLRHRCTIELLADTEVNRAANDRDVFIDRMFMRRNDRARQFTDAHYKRLACSGRVAVQDFNILGERSQRDDSMLADCL